MRIAYIGPQGRNSVLQGWASPGVVVETRSANFNGVIESQYDEYLYVPRLLEAVEQIEGDGFDAALVGCFGDPGLDGVRELARMPVVGPAEASLHVAAMLADRFGIITATPEIRSPLYRLAERYHVDRQLTGVTDIGCPILDIRRDPDAHYPVLVEVARRMLREQGAQALVLGCGSMAFYADRLAGDTGVPCVNPLRVGLKMCELLAGAGLTHSKLTYPYPSSRRTPAEPHAVAR
ncbi:MAG TPA: aspartate/glutamate racemase family protein [bacterium]|nr:aspartate/glutamate racemase family protein [bacterium]